ncbi:MAG: hypothetical protein CMG46_00150 [Candidatus Marinimicrobia bacterium]|nr:hypothetical protein [Candidatus Neomarinimicrobiota bacterium]
MKDNILCSLNIPEPFSNKEEILNFNFNSIDPLINSEIDYSYTIDGLYENIGTKVDIVKSYYKSILHGYSHIYIDKVVNKYGENCNIQLPLLNRWNNITSIDNIIIINNPVDANRIAKKHIQKAPIFKSILNDSIISTTNNNLWKDQRNNMNPLFLIEKSLLHIFPISKERAIYCTELIKDITNNYTIPMNCSEFFLNETQAQLQLALFGFSNDFQLKTNKKLRDAFSGINIEYINEFSKLAFKEIQNGSGPLSIYLKNEPVEVIEQTIGNIILFAFAGHDTTGHTLTWLLYELCRYPSYKQRLIEEIDLYWRNNLEEKYETFTELPFMSACIIETLRLWPPIPNGTFRELETDEEINGINGTVTIPKGTYCQIFNWSRQRSSELWGNDSHIFNPDREFTDKELWPDGFGAYNLASDRYSPFTFGPRNCIGKNFAHMEMRLILLNIFKEHDYELSPDQYNSIDESYLGNNTFTMGPTDIYDPTKIGMYVNVFQRKCKL